jgi:selenide,water dikinase
VQSVDFITPVLNDPYAYGAVAAANAISDIYAVGAKPVFALNVVEFPVKSLPLSILEEILKGGADKALEAGVSIAGGHSIECNAPKYGMAVTGFVEPTKLVKKKGAKPGDVLFLTKPLGTGILTTAIDRGLAGTDTEQELYQIMAHLNRDAAEAMQIVGVHACTDITGFGLLGHLAEMLTAGGVAARISLSKIPLITGAKELAKEGAIPAGTHNNYRFIRNNVKWESVKSQEDMMLLCDAQTSGGLLIAVAQEKADKLRDALVQGGCLVTAEIGVITDQKEKLIEIVS